MSERFVYENARIKSLEVKLLTRQSMQRLIDCASPEAAFKTLVDLGFGVGAGVAPGDFDALFAFEEEKSVALIKEFNVGGALDALLLTYDFLNLKLILKAKAMGKIATASGLEGLMTFDEVSDLVDLPDEKLTGELGGAIADVRALSAKGEAGPRGIDVAVDKRMFKAAKAAAKDKILKEYFVLKIGGINLLSLLRTKRLGLDAAFFAEGYIEGGSPEVKDVFDLSNDAIIEAVKGNAFYEPFKKALENMDVISFEVAADNVLLAKVRSARDDMFSPAPILSYCLQKQTELKAAKLIVAGIRNGVDPAVIKERLRDVNA